MAAQAKKNYGRGLDLAILPETAITGEGGDDAPAHSVSFEGEVQDAFTRTAREHGCYIVSSTWRHNASFFEPTGKIAAQIKPPQSILVHELDLSYALLPWSSKLQNGEALRQAYGDKVGFHYYEDEDCGIFWSNDPKTTIGEMVRSIGVLELEEEMARVRQFYRAAGVRR
jgi:predicted amidohydrolase